MFGLIYQPAITDQVLAGRSRPHLLKCRTCTLHDDGSRTVYWEPMRSWTANPRLDPYTVPMLMLKCYSGMTAREAIEEIPERMI